MATTLRMPIGGSKGGGDPPPASATPTDSPRDDGRFDADLPPPTPPVPVVASASSAPAPDGASVSPVVADAASAAAPFASGRPQCPQCSERFSRGSRFCAFDGARLVDTAEEPFTDPLVGQVLDGKYTVLRPIGEGGMGTVYEVRHNALDRRFALKVLRPDIAQNAEHMQRFLQEAKAAAAIGHPNIVSVSDFGYCDVRGHRVPYFVMEFLPGTSLAALLKAEKTLHARRCAKIIAACAEALAAAHASGVIHRDLKPDNIFLTGDSGDVVKVLDFGVAKMQGAARLTKLGMVFGTPHYMSPEQARGQPIDHRADIYALGVILYECLSGRVPFEADTSMGVLTKQIFANPEPIERVSLDPRGLGALGAIVMRCLAKEPDERYASMDELAAAIREVVTNPEGAAAHAIGAGRPRHRGLHLREETAIPRSEPPPDEPTPRAWTRVVGLAAIGVAALALLIVATRALFFAPSAPSAPSTASAVAAATAPSTAAPATAPSPGATGAAEAPTAPSGAASETPSTAATSSAAPSAASGPSQGGQSAGPSSGSTSAAAPPAAPSSTGKPTPPRSTNVVDPWGTPTKKPASNGVVDPWQRKK